MKKSCLIILLTSIYILSYAQDNNAKVIIKQSQEFESESKHTILSPIPYGEKGILQVNNRGVKSFNFQFFSNDLKKLKEKTIEEVDEKLSDKASYPVFTKIADKTYLFVRDVYRDRDKEGVSYLEFDVDKLAFAPTDKKLFESSDKVVSNVFNMWGWGDDFQDENSTTIGSYAMDVSRNEKCVLFTYRLKPERRNDKLSNDVIGMQVFDPNMNKIWGDEVRMPYTEAKMDNLSYIISDDGKVYLLAKVYEGDSPKEGRDKDIPNYHLELLVYEKDKKTPEIITISTEGIVPKSASLFETEKGELLLTGFYSKTIRKPIDGAFVMSFDKTKRQLSMLNGGRFEIPSDLIKSFASKREIRALERKENKDKEGDIGVENLRVRFIHLLADGTIFLSAEDYKVTVHTSTSFNNNVSTTRTTYSTDAKDIYVICASPNGSSWVKKIPKTQSSNDASGPELSYNTIFHDGRMYFFYVDNKKNLSLAPDENPKEHRQGFSGYLACVSFDMNGTMEKHLLGEISDFETNFYIRRFVQGDFDNLIYTARKRKNNTLISIQPNR